MVVLFHAHIYILPQKIEEGASFFRGFNMGYAGVEIFFVISGFFMWYIHHMDVGNPARYLRFLYKRVSRIYPLYLAVLLGLSVLYFIFPNSGPENARDLSHILLSATLLPMEKTPIMEVAWTLQHEMLFYVMFSFLILNKKAGCWILSIWAALCLGNSFSPTDSFPFSFLVSAYNLLFFFGMGAAFVISKIEIRAAKSLLCLGVLLYLSVGLSEVYHLVLWDKSIRTICYGLGASLMMAIVQMEKSGNIRFSKASTILGDASYSIYLVHMPFMLIAMEMLNRLNLSSFLPSPILFGLLISGAIVCGLCVYFVFEKPVMGFFNRRKILYPSPILPATT